MQNKGIVITTAVLLTLVSLFYLSFPIATSYYDSQAAKRPDAIAQQDYKDSVKYLGIYSYQKCLETQIGLGLDLKGGMNVILEISVPDVVENLADHKTDIAFTRSMDEARKEQQATQGDFISLFIKAYHKNAPGHKLAEVFATTELQGKVSPTSTDSEVEKVLRSEVSSAIDNSFNVVRTRIDQFGVVQPNIQKVQGAEGRISVEMPGIREPERMRKLLQGSANLEFWETYNADEVLPYLQQLDQRMANGDAEEKTVADSTKENKDVAAAKATAEKEVKKAKQEQPKFQLNKGKNAKKDIKMTPDDQLQQAKKLHPLLAMLQTTGQGLSVCGYASVRDTAAINKIIYSKLAKQILPSDLKLLWSAKPADGIQAKNIFELHALKVTTTNGRAPLEGDVITDAKDEFNQLTGQPEVSMTMNADGARRWAELTKANVGKAITIVLDGVVYSAPRVNGEISGGQSSISGNFTVQDTKDLANTLKSGRMPAPAHIVQEEVVGPTLGAQSIQQGIFSFIVAFVLLIVFMLAIYNIIPGSIAIGALLINVFFTLGILTSFQAALTMSGIAGMVLSLGTAVDANVLVYERIKEELRKGKDMKKAVAEGYSNAFSAIFDSNVTTILTGIILYNFGTGPIKGFATTLIIGIVCSFFTAVWLTRIAYEHFLNRGKWQDLKFTTKFSQNMMKDTTFNFMGNYKKSFIAFGIFLVIVLVSFGLRGLSQSIDFTGGRNYKVEFAKQVEPEAVKASIVKQFEANNPDGEAINVTVIAIGTEGNNVRVSTNVNIEDNSSAADAQIESLLYQAFVDGGMVDKSVSEEAFLDRDNRAGGSIISSQKVGPAIASDILRGAVLSVLFAIVVIFLYILIRFRNVAYSVGSIVALTLDTVLVIGMFSLCYGWIGFSLEVDQTFIGAILTVIGYSINDKVVIFDRIREVFKNYPKRDRQRIFNDALNSTLARTINTSVSTFIVLLVIFVLGGDSIRAFAFAMMLGVIIGTSSSLFIAAPTAYLVMGARIKEAEEETESAQ